MYVCMSVCARACVHVWARACMCVGNFSPLRHYAKDGKKLHSIAATKTMRSTTSKRLLSMTPSRQRNYFRCPVALSTCIQSAAIDLVAITSWGSICWRLSKRQECSNKYLREQVYRRCHLLSAITESPRSSFFNKLLASTRSRS